MAHLEIITSARAMHEYSTALREGGTKIGFVPTMGALHKGHASLIDIARKHCDLVVSSIFVNPTQFNNPDDLKKYPRTFDDDRHLLESHGCNIIFFPDVNEMYPHGLQTIDMDLQQLDKVMEGAHRPGHFAGVVTVVKNLFEIVRPHQAFFGEKDFQQLAIIKYMVQYLGMRITITGCPTIREADGLAFSSRNIHLTPAERDKAHIIFQTLEACRSKKKTMTVPQLIHWATQQINSSEVLTTEYIECVNAWTLEPLVDWDDCEEQRICAAVTVSKTRLIDNGPL